MGKPSLKSIRFALSKKLLVTSIILVVLIFSGVGIYLYSQNIVNVGIPGVNSQQEKASFSEAEDLIETVGEKYMLPDEIPTIATVSDKNELADQEFFAKAENGDKVLIYRDSEIAIIYRPSVDKIINVGPVIVNEEGITGTDQSINAESEELEEVGVLILNGTTTVGLTQVAANDLADLEFMSVDDRLDAVNKPYENTVVVYSSSEFMAQAEAIADSLSATTIDELPGGEESNSDITIILGDDYASTSSE